jgi:hypothetical protein
MRKAALGGRLRAGQRAAPALEAQALRSPQFTTQHVRAIAAH